MDVQTVAGSGSSSNESHSETARRNLVLDFRNLSWKLSYFHVFQGVESITFMLQGLIISTAFTEITNHKSHETPNNEPLLPQTEVGSSIQG